jgi:hypothetical protein
MGKKSFPKRPSGGFRSSTKKFYVTAGIEPVRIGGKKVKSPEEDTIEPLVDEIPPYRESVLYTAPIIQALPEEPLLVKKEAKSCSLGENFMRGLWNFMRGERAG